MARRNTADNVRHENYIQNRKRRQRGKDEIEETGKDEETAQGQEGTLQVNPAPNNKRGNGRPSPDTFIAESFRVGSVDEDQRSSGREKTALRKKRSSGRPKGDHDADIPESSTYVLIDEFGNVGLDAGKERYVGAGATFVKGRDKERFGRISEQVREEKGVQEIKRHDLKEQDRARMRREMSAIETRVVGVFIDKAAADNPDWWPNPKKHRSRQYVKMIEELAADIMDEDPDHLAVVIDHNTAYKGSNAEDRIAEAAKGRKNIVYNKQEDSETGRHKDLMQTNDIMIGDVMESVENQKLSGQNVRIRRITKDNSKIKR